ncbi:hypothetical protein GCM10020000_31870 [Streptomyces olivoverticillatus]
MGNWWAGGEQHALDGLEPLQLPDVRAEPVDGQRHRAQAGPFDGVAVVPEAVRLHAQLAHAAPPQGPAQQCEALDEARAHHDPPRVGAHPAGAGEVVGEGLPQLGAASPVAVAERLVRGRGQGAAGGGEPAGAREGGDVAGAGAQVVGGTGGIRGGGAGRGAGGRGAARRATRVPEPWRAVSQPSATSSP